MDLGIPYDCVWKVQYFSERGICIHQILSGLYWCQKIKSQHLHHANSIRLLGKLNMSILFIKPYFYLKECNPLRGWDTATRLFRLELPSAFSVSPLSQVICFARWPLMTLTGQTAPPCCILKVWSERKYQQKRLALQFAVYILLNLYVVW